MHRYDTRKRKRDVAAWSALPACRDAWSTVATFLTTPERYRLLRLHPQLYQWFRDHTLLWRTVVLPTAAGLVRFLRADTAHVLLLQARHGTIPDKATGWLQTLTSRDGMVVGGHGLAVHTLREKSMAPSISRPHLRCCRWIIEGHPTADICLDGGRSPTPQEIIVLRGSRVIIGALDVPLLRLPYDCHLIVDVETSTIRVLELFHVPTGVTEAAVRARLVANIHTLRLVRGPVQI